MPKPNHHPIVEQANQIFEKLVQWRRTFHQYPELSFKEFGTSKFITETLQQIKGIKVETGVGVETSVVGTLTSLGQVDMEHILS